MNGETLKFVQQALEAGDEPLAKHLETLERNVMMALDDAWRWKRAYEELVKDERWRRNDHPTGS